MVMLSKQLDYKSGADRWKAHLFLILCFQSVFFASMVVCFYAVITFDWKLSLFLLAVSISQQFVKRSQVVIRALNCYVKPLNYYKSFRRIYEEPLKQEEQQIFCFHPHSVFAYCIISNMNCDETRVSKMTVLGSRMILIMPFIGLQLRLWGVEPVNKSNFQRQMKAKKPLGISPGGFQQASLTSPKQIRVYIKHRKGFIKEALKFGYTIYPALVYNEHKGFWTLDRFQKFRLFLNRFKVPGVIFGMGFLWIFLPLNLKIVTIIGKGIRRQRKYKGKVPSNQEVDQVHQKYIKQIERMHRKNRFRFGETSLKIY